jgi:predicted RNA-binding protein YlqC (UPF0109 family)
MIKLLKDLTSAIVDHPDQVTVEEVTNEDGLTTLKLRVHYEDMGRVIGKEGKIIQALRTLMRVAAIKKGKRIRIELIEPEQSPPPEPPQPSKKPKKTESK